MNAQALLIGIDDAAEMLSMTPRRLIRLARQGVVPVIDLGDGEMRFSPDDLREWVKGLTRQEAVPS